MLDEAGLESTLDWYIPTVERQTGIAISYEKQGEPFPVDGSAGVHVYRVLQEALNNVARHSGAKQAWVRLRFLPSTLELEVRIMARDFTERPEPARHRPGRHARACGIDGRADVFSRPPEGGTLVHLTVPREKGVESGILWKRRSQCCSWMITAWFAVGFAACWKTSRTWRSSAKRATARNPSSWRNSFIPRWWSWIARCRA